MKVSIIIPTNNLSYYEVALETPHTGDKNNSGYYFDYNSKGDDIIVVKAGSTSSGSTTDVTTDEIINESCSDKEAPTCKLNYFAPRSSKDGMTASFTCIDNTDVTSISSYFDEKRTTAATSFKEIGTLKPGIKIEKGMRWNSIWTSATDPLHIPYPNTCYYFHYGAEDACGNFKSYVTNYCLSY